MSTETTVAVANLKPGTGKTTTAVFLCRAFHELGMAPLLVDADPGASALRWSDLAGGFPWPVVGMATKSLRNQLRTLTARSDHGAVVIDCPQLEDHTAISVPALQFARHWVIPCAPAGIELDRTTFVHQVLDDVDAYLDTPGQRWALLNRTNRRARSKAGPDAQCAEILTEQGYRVFGEQVHHADGLYRQAFGTVPGLDGTPFVAIAEQLVKGAA